ncbi:MAG: hypothetical protein V1845_02535 [bacterium]
MATIVVYGLPDGLGEEKVSELCELIRKATVKERELRLNIEDVLAWFNKDQMLGDLGKEFSVRIEGIKILPADEHKMRTVSGLLAAHLVMVIKNFFDKTELIEFNMYFTVEGREGVCLYFSNRYRWRAQA